MPFSFPKIRFPFFERYLNGDSFYQVNEVDKWCGLYSNIEIAQNHPILTPAILFVAKLFSQAEFYLEDQNTGKKIYEHWLLDLLRQPNYYQTQIDFLELHNFTLIANGKAIVYISRTIGGLKPTSFYILDPDRIEWPDEFRTNLRSTNLNNTVQNQYIIYDKDGENKRIAIKDLLFFYDLPNGINTSNMFEARSRIDGLGQTLKNTKDSLLAKNIILKTNGKELITGDRGAGSFPMDDKEKADAEKLFFGNYGLGSNRKRGLITKASLKWQSLHIALRDLGLDESVKVDGNLIYTALHIPKDILSLEAKKTTYNNFKESMVSYIQNEMQPTLNAFLMPFQALITEKNLKLRGNYESMPIMQHILIERFDGVKKRAEALKMLREAGLPDEIALELCGFESSIKLNELMQNIMQNGNGQEQNNDNESEN